MKKEQTMKIATLTAAALTAVCVLADEKPAYLDTSLTFEERAADLVSRMTLEEKTGQLGRNAGKVAARRRPTRARRTSATTTRASTATSSSGRTCRP